jgi:NTE family protein
VGALVAAGVKAADLVTVLNRDYGQLRDGTLLTHLGLPGKAVSLALMKGLYRGDRLQALIEELLPPGARRFEALADDDPGSALPPERRYRLVVTASDVSGGRLCRWPWDCAEYFGPDPARWPSVAEAVRASASIPFFYRPVQARTADGREAYFVDGGMLSNFPVDLFDRPDGEAPRFPTFGIRLSARPAVPPTNRITSTYGLARAVLSTLTGFYDRLHVSGDVEDRTIFVDTLGLTSTDFGISTTQQRALYRSGREAAERFLGTWNWDRYLERRLHREAAAVG